MLREESWQLTVGSQKREVVTLREPGGTEVAEKIRAILLESKGDKPYR